MNRVARETVSPITWDCLGGRDENQKLTFLYPPSGRGWTDEF